MARCGRLSLCEADVQRFTRGQPRRGVPRGIATATGLLRLRGGAPACPLTANLSSVPARKSHDDCANQPDAVENRQLTPTLEPPILRLA